MKKTTILYWIFTGLLALLMTFSALGGLLDPKAADGIKQLGYPAYLLSFLGIAKLAGVVAILVPGFPRLKEWAYAGFVFDLTGALYSSIASGLHASAWMPILIGPVLVACSYIFYHKRLRQGSIIVRPNLSGVGIN